MGYIYTHRLLSPVETNISTQQTKLYICEKPSQARDIARILKATKKSEGYIQGHNIIVTWCLGHLVETAKPEHYRPDIKPWRINKLPIIPEQWHLFPVDKVKKQLNIVKKLINNTNSIVVATDADREGELIARELLDLCKYKGSIERLWLSALDDDSIIKALKNIKPGSATENLYYAGLGRQRADWLTGMNMTMATSSLFGKYGQGVLSVGRVQTPTLQLIVDRDLRIENFENQFYYELYAKFVDHLDSSLWLKWSPSKKVLDEETNKCLDKDVITQVIEKIHHKPAVITEFKKTNKKQPPPILFTLSALQKKASSLYGYTAKKTLAIAQSLYEKHKATSYPRTDSGYLPISQFSEAENILNILKNIDASISELITNCNTSYKSPAWNDKKVTAHHGIIPTANSKVKLSAMSQDELNIYKLIRNLYIAQFLGDYLYKQTKISVKCSNEIFTATGTIPGPLAWKQALENFKFNDTPSGDDHTVQKIPDWKKSQQLQESQEKAAQKKTKPPGRFTEGTLIAAMESIGKHVEDKELKKILKETSGIGTQATRAAIIETLINREFVRRNKKQLISTDKGRELLNLLPRIVKDPATTARWEQDLEDIAQGYLKLDEFITKQNTNIAYMIEELKKHKGVINTDDDQSSLNSSNKPKIKIACSLCGNDMQRKKTKANNRFFWGCSTYPDCKSTLPDYNGTPGKPRQPAQKTDIKCTACNEGYMVERAGKYGKFYGCSNYPKCKNLLKNLEAIKTPEPA